VGQPFDRAALKRLLSNVLYCGEVRHKGKAYPGEQEAMVDRQIWQQAQVLLRKSMSVDRARRRPGALLQDVLHCGVCGSRMVAGHSTKKKRRYSYYVCRTAQQQGAAVCPGQSIPAKRLEDALLGRLQELAESDEWKPLQEACRPSILHYVLTGEGQCQRHQWLDIATRSDCRQQHTHGNPDRRPAMAGW
jgi:hypothetical protein